MTGFQLRRMGFVMKPERGNPLEAEGILNPAAVRGPDGQLYLLPRLVARGNYSRIGIARVRFNEAGDPVGAERLGIALEPEADYERHPGGGGCEDPRITFVEPLQRYVMTYTAFSAEGPRIALALSKDLFHWQRLGLASFRPCDGIEFNGVDNKDASVFPAAILDPSGKPALAMLHRPLFPGTRPEETAGRPHSDAVDLHRESIWISYCPMTTDGREPYQLGQFIAHHRLASPVAPWERLKIGGGTPPVLTRHGWLILYHGVCETEEASQAGRKLRYSAGLMVLSEEHPRIVRYRSPEPVLTPDLPQERRGTVANVVFPTGIDRRDDIGSPERLDVYYGMADDRIGVASLDVPEFLPPGAPAHRGDQGSHSKMRRRASLTSSAMWLRFAEICFFSSRGSGPTGQQAKRIFLRGARSGVSWLRPAPDGGPWNPLCLTGKTQSRRCRGRRPHAAQIHLSSSRWLVNDWVAQRLDRTMAKARGQKRPPLQTTVDREPAIGAEEDSVDQELMKRLWNFWAQFREGNDPEKVFRSALRLGFDALGAKEGCLVTIPPGRNEPDILYREPRGSVWDKDLLTGFLRGHKATIPPDLMLARVRRHQRMWGALAIRRSGADFRWDARQAFSSIGAVASQLVNDFDAARVRDVRNRIDRKLLDQVGPKNLFYEILHGIRSLTGYDHSAALLMCDRDETSLEIVAEQISWRKAKSQMIGTKILLSGELVTLLRGEEIVGFDRDERGWHGWSGNGHTRLAELMDFHPIRPDSKDLVPEGAILCAPLTTRDGLLGLLKVAAVREGTFGRHEADLIGQFLPQAALALHGWRRTQSLEMQVLAAERKHAMADLARGVAHDINNALGVVLPLVQELQVDLEEGQLNSDVLSADLRQIEQSLQLCRRVFGGMLKFARSMAHNVSEVYLHDAVDSALSILRDSLERRGLEIDVDVPTSLLPIKSVQSDVEQLLINLMNNAADAMDAGGHLSIRACQNGESIQLSVEDTGCGIRAEDLPKIQEPFFTTKPTGNGLGLAICRSIASQMGGRLQFESQVGKGTHVTLMLPVASESPG